MRTKTIVFGTWIASALLALAPLAAAAEETLELPGGAPMATIRFPVVHETRELTVAVSKAMIEQKWEGLAWTDNVVTARSWHSVGTGNMEIQVFAVVSARSVKLFARYDHRTGHSEEHAHKVALHQIQKLENRIARDLGLELDHGKGRDGSDIAT